MDPLKVEKRMIFVFGSCRAITTLSILRKTIKKVGMIKLPFHPDYR
jgi:hypothetical protein